MERTVLSPYLFAMLPTTPNNDPHELRLKVLDGVVYLLIDDEDEFILTPGDEAVVPAGSDYAWWNAGDDEAQVRVIGPRASAECREPRREIRRRSSRRGSRAATRARA